MTEEPRLPDDWTEPETWAWQRIAAGEVADFNKRAERTLDARSDDGWTSDRRLRARFLRTILTEQRFVAATPFTGVRIFGALIDDEVIDLEQARLPHLVWLQQSRITTALHARNLRVDGSLSLQASCVVGDVQLMAARITESISLAEGLFRGPVDMDSAKVTGALLLRHGATFENDLNLVNVEIGAKLDMTGSIFRGEVDLQSAKVTGAAFLAGGAVFDKTVDLVGAGIGADLDLSDASFGAIVRLTNTRIASELRLGSNLLPPARWPGGTLILRNCRCSNLQDCWPTTTSPEEDSWPARIDLEGFTYDQLGGLLGSGDGPWNMRDRPAKAYAEWLKRDTPYSPQPYQQLAKVLRQSGEPAKANDILYAARERQKDTLGDGTLRGAIGWVGMWLLKWTIGYGIGLRYFRVLAPVLALTGLGALLLHQFGEQQERDWLRLTFASFDQLLPIVTLDSAHDKLFSNASVATPRDALSHSAPGDQFGIEKAQAALVQPHWLIGYFYVHKLIGWLLGLFLAAGLAGLTQRN